MKILFEFRCQSCNTKEEHLTTRDTTQVRCKKCDSVSNRVISGGRPLLDPISGDFPGSTIKWARHHERMAKAGADAND